LSFAVFAVRVAFTAESDEVKERKRSEEESEYRLDGVNKRFADREIYVELKSPRGRKKVD
jgi:hypothetical protein